jgi:hypothetical protein
MYVEKKLEIIVICFPELMFLPEISYTLITLATMSRIFPLAHCPVKMQVK